MTAQDPDTGVKILDTLRIIRRYRSDVETDEPLPFGAWGGVEQPGRVRVGDSSGAVVSIDPATSVGDVVLTVADADAQAAFYRDAIGLRELRRDGETVELGAPGSR